METHSISDVYMYFVNYVDPYQILKELERTKVQLPVEYDVLRRQHNTTIYNYIFFILIKGHIRGSTLIYILEKTGNSDLFMRLHLYFQNVKPTSFSVATVARIDPQIKGPVRSYFNDIKIRFLTACDDFKDPISVFHKESDTIDRRLGLTTNEHARKLLYDMKIALIANVIDACLMIFKSTQDFTHLFKELEKSIPFSSNETLSDVVFYSRIAIRQDTYCYDEGHCKKLSESDGDEMYMKAHMCAASYAPCLEMANLFYFHLLHEIWRFAKHPTWETKQSISQLGNIALECLLEEPENIRLLYKFIVCIKCACCLLGIGVNKAQIPGYIPNDLDINKARVYLNTIDECRKLVPVPRKIDMSYKLARSRQYEYTGDVLTSYMYVKEAYQMCIVSNYRELDIVRAYFDNAEQKYNYEIRRSVSRLDPEGESDGEAEQNLEKNENVYLESAPDLTFSEDLSS